MLREASGPRLPGGCGRVGVLKIPLPLRCPTVRRIPRPVALVAMSLAVLTGAGCSTMSPLTTQLEYVPGDGEVVRIGDTITIANVLIAAEEPGAPGNLVARIVNEGTDPITVVIESDEVEADVRVRVPPGETVDIGPEGQERFLIEEVEAVPGTLIPFRAGIPGTDLVEDLLVPVYDGTLPRFEELLPEPDATAGTS